MYTDRIDLSIPQEDLESVLADIASATATLEFLPLLNPSDRKHLAKLGLKNEGLARTIIEVGRANAGLIPRDIDFEKVDRDLLARDQLWNLRLVLQNLLGRIDGALMLTGVDLYAAALEMYHCLRRNADRTGLRDIVDDLKKGFARPSRKKKKELEPAAEAAVTVIVPAPESVVQAPESEPVTPERRAPAVPPGVPAVTVVAAEPERRIQPRPLLPGLPQSEAASALHISTFQPSHIFSGGLTPPTSVYVHHDAVQHRTIGFSGSHTTSESESSQS